MVALDDDSNEYEMVRKTFNAGVANEVVRIEKNLNVGLADKYSRYADEIKVHNSHVLFHGSKKQNWYDGILQNGVDVDKAVRYLPASKKSIFFAPSASTSHGYNTTVDVDGDMYKNMLLCQVNLGNKDVHYGSMTGNFEPNVYNEFWIYGNGQVYPKYLIYYEM